MNQQPEPGSNWPLERALFLMAGTMTILSAILAAVFSPWFLLLTGFTGVSQLLFVTVGACPASLVLSRTLGLKSACYADSEAKAAR
jgi:hypothetical protein